MTTPSKVTEPKSRVKMPSRGPETNSESSSYQ